MFFFFFVLSNSGVSVQNHTVHQMRFGGPVLFSSVLFRNLLRGKWNLALSAYAAQRHHDILITFLLLQIMQD